jgi:DNA-binding transcriptional MocR family regulator
LRVLLHLAAHAQPPEFTVQQSSREIAKATGVARSAVVRAIDDLTEKRFITTRQGTATKASAYQLNFLLTVEMGGSPGEPPRSVERLSPITPLR